MNKPLHIAIVGPVAGADITPLLQGDGPWPQGYGGAPLMATLIAELLQRGHRVTAITTSNELPLAAHFRVQARGPNFSMVWCPMRPRAWPFNRVHPLALGGWLGWLPGRIVDGYGFERRQLHEAILDAAPDIVHAHWCYEFAAAALASGLPHLITCHDDPQRVLHDQQRWRDRGYRWLRARLARRVLARAQAVSVVSPWLAEQLQPAAATPLLCVPNPLRIGGFATRRQAEPGRRRVLIVANGFGLNKNVQTGLRAFARLSEQAPVAELVLVGDQMQPDGPAARWWGEQGSGSAQGGRGSLQSGRGRVRFVGPQSAIDTQHWMVHSDVLLHPARHEAFGMVVAEALAIGLPVVAGRTSGAVPWLVGDAATLVDVGDAEALANAVLAVWQDPVAAETRAARGRRAMRERFAAPVVGAAYEALYRSVLAGPRPGNKP